MFINKVAKHTQTIRRQFADNCLSVFGHFVGLALKGLKERAFIPLLQKLCFFNHQASKKIKALHFVAWTWNESDQSNSGLVKSSSNP